MGIVQDIFGRKSCSCDTDILLEAAGGDSLIIGLCFYLLNQLDTGLEIHTEVNKLPINTLTLVLFLFQDEHVVVEELLQFLIGEVDAQLLKTVVLICKSGEQVGDCFCFREIFWMGRSRYRELS